MLVNMSDSEVQLLDIETADVVRQFLGQKQGNFIIRSTFGEQQRISLSAAVKVGNATTPER
jgi:hypothetical protein